MSNPIKTERSPLATQLVNIAGLVIFAVLVGWSGPVNAQGGKGAWVFVDARLDEVNTYYLKNDPCFDTKIGMPSWKSMFHYIGGKGCPAAPKNEYSQFGFQWTDPGSPLIPDSVVQMTLTATIEFDKLRPDADRGAGAITVYVSIDDKGRRNAVGDDQLLIGGGKKGNWHLPTSANKTIEWKVPRGWAKDNRLQISMQGSAPQTKQIYNYWYEWREGFSAAAPPLSAPVTKAAGEREVFNNNNIAGVNNSPSTATTFKTDRSWLVTYVTTYHWNGGRGQTPGGISLRHQDGTSYGPWQASGRPSQGSQTNLYWECWPNVVIKPGVYTVIDSHPASWAWNAQSGGGIAEIKGVP